MDIESVISSLQNHEAQKAELDKQIKVIKIQGNFDLISKVIKSNRLILYQYMLDHDLQEYAGYSIDKLLPSAEKKLRTKQKKMEKYAALLDVELQKPEVEIEELADKLLDL
jgi:hypothetical protein